LYEQALTPSDEKATKRAGKSHNAISIVDLRSDTVTKPTLSMRRAMSEAEVGDDVYGEDPTVNRLQSRAAELFDREAALFVPSGSMGNLLAIKTWTRPGEEVICEERAHVNHYELASMSAIAGCFPRPVFAPDGILTWDLIEPRLRPKIYYYSQTSLITIENSHNMAGGSVYSAEAVAEICDRAHDAGLRVHLDGARIFNAAVATGRTVADLSRKCDSVMFCLSKGLGAPAGSLVLGSHDFIGKARVARKMLGGGMRQIGVLAAAGLLALEDSPKILGRDHENARFLAQGLARIAGIAVEQEKVITNIVIFDVRGTGKTAAELSAALAKERILSNPSDNYALRMVTHYDVDREGCQRALEVMARIVAL
jgi:threonine aldolase